ncbi:hypothetical protein N431DRAFT_460512 [Stipitochalara longipes BDJ]|nr:hypothetical protein N431DRAFT_460512 [Stipitochalara longipes BDJ]
MTIILPYEVKRLIYDYVDLRTLKSLRLTSASWAVVGLEVLLLPSFTIRSYSIDIPRLIAIGASPDVSRQAARVIKKVKVYSSTPQVNAVEVICPNPFKHRILRKVWEEYNLETYRSIQLEQGSSQLVDILSAAKEAGLDIHHLGHDQLTSYFFTSAEDPMSQDIYGYLKGLKSLNFTICNREQDFPSNNNAILRLRNIISSSPELESIYIKFELLGPLSLDFLPETPPLPTKLHTLTLCGVSMDTARFIPFLEKQSGCLRRLSITSAEMVEGNWKNFLQEMRDKFGSTLEKFQLAGVLKDSDQTWMTLPIYNADWSDLDSVWRNKRRAKEIESFVLRAGDWPMTSEDDISSMLA